MLEKRTVKVVTGNLALSNLSFVLMFIRKPQKPTVAPFHLVRASTRSLIYLEAQNILFDVLFYLPLSLL